MNAAWLIAVVWTLQCSAAFAQGFVYPVGNSNIRPTHVAGNANGFRITQTFGNVKHHTGVDLADGTEGGEVRAIGPGKVVAVGTTATSRGWGNVVLIRHDLPEGTVYSLYAHLQEGSVLVQPNADILVPGVPIGKVDCTGNTEGQSVCHSNGRTGSHLHFGIRKVANFGCGYIDNKCTTDSFANYVGDPLQFIADHQQVALAPTAGFTMTSGLYAAHEGQTLNLQAPPDGDTQVTFTAPTCATGQTLGCSRSPAGNITSWLWTVTIAGFPLVHSEQTFTRVLTPGVVQVSLQVENDAGVRSLVVSATVMVATLNPTIRQLTHTTDTGTKQPLSISPDGATVVFGDGQGEVFTGQSSTGNVTQVPIQGTVATFDPSVSRYGFGMGAGKLALVACTAPSCTPAFDGNIYLVNPDGSEQTPMTTGGRIRPTFPGFLSGDGKLFVYTTSRNHGSLGRDQMFAVPTDGSGETELVLSGCQGGCSGGLSRDGSTFAYVTGFGAGFGDIAITNTDGTGERPLSVMDLGYKNVALSGDGRLVAFIKGSRLYVIPAAGGEPTPLAAVDGFFSQTDHRVSLNYDANRVLLNGNVAHLKSDVFLINADGTGLFNISRTPNGSDAYGNSLSSFGGVLSENGSTVAFTSSADLVPGSNADRNFEVFVAILSPSLSVDLGTTSCRPHSQTFEFSGFGFAPIGNVHRYLRQPNGAVSELTPPLSADTAGRVTWQFPVPAGYPLGSYALWAVDAATGRPSNVVYEVIGAQAGCSATSQ